MRKNLLRQLTLALLLTAAVPTLTAQVHVGDILCEGNAIISPANYPSSGATAIGVVFYVDNTGQHGWAVALPNASGKWSNSDHNTPLPNYTNSRQAIQDLNGYENTRIVRNTSSSNYPIFNNVDFANGWYVPAIGQLNYLYGNIQEVNATLAEVGGTIFSSSNWNLWSSTETNDNTAWVLMSSGLLKSNYYKTNSFNIRAVRNF